MAEAYWYLCDECGGPSLYYDHARQYCICETCIKDEPKRQAKKMIKDWKRKENEPT